MHTLELLGTPIGTGTLYVVDSTHGLSQIDECSDDEITESQDIENWYRNIKRQNLVKEKRRLNRATETNETLVIEYLTNGGYKNLNTFDLEDRKLYRVASSLHAGSGPLVWGMTGAQKCDLTLSFEKEDDSPAVLYYINYHGAYYHYKGHLDTCPSGNQTMYPYEPNPADIVMDAFRHKYALKMSCVYPENVRFIYDKVYECDFFHGNQRQVFTLDKGLTLFDTIKQAVQSVPDHIYSRKFTQTYNVGKLLEGIKNGTITGFITIKGGQESASNDANDFFGYCVQNYTPKSNEISPLTKNQLMHFKGYKTADEISQFLEKHQIGLTLNSGTFHSEETISTEYLKWLMEARNFTRFQVTHFLEYKFVEHSRTFLEPLLEERHEAKMSKDAISAECLKLICNGSYGYNALESSNYSSCRLITAKNLKRNQSTISAFLSLDRIQLIGIVQTKKKSKQKTSSNSLLIEEAIDDNEEEEDDEEDYEYDFLYSVIVSGKEKPIKNSLPKAVSILSNSKKLFLSHIQLLLECLDPRLAELCYIDTDSCIFSLTNSQIEDCLIDEKKEFFISKAILADETSRNSFHGKLKCEGVYEGGHFRTIKIYRLYSKKDLYTRCKGVNRNQADKLPNTTFDNNDLSINTIERRALRPTAAGEMCITHESRSLACPINLKRYVMPDGVHTIPLSLATAWEETLT